MTFAAIEARATAAAFRRLANARATFGEFDEPVDVVFDAARGSVDDLGLQSVEPTLLMQPSSAPDVKDGDAILVDMPELGFVAAPYVVRQVLPLAEGGFQRLVLAKG